MNGNANKNANNLTPQDIIEWQKKLGFLKITERKDGVFNSNTGPTKSNASSGYFVIDDIIFNYGYKTYGNQTFAKPFTKAVFCVLAVPCQSGSKSTYANLNVYSVSLTGFNARYGATNSSDSGNVNYLAIGI